MATTTDPDEVDLGELSREAHAYARSGRRRFMLALASLSSALVAKEPVDIPTWVTANLFMPAEKTTRGGPIVLTPIQAAIARFWQTPGVEQVTFLKPPRIGSSFINGAGLLYYACHEAQDVIFYERSEQTAQEFNNDKLMPILRSSVSVSGLIRPDSKTGEQDRWTDRMLMNGAGLKLRSVSNNGAFRGIRGRFICADEAGSPEYNSSGKRTEGSKVDLIKRRGQEFADFVLYIGGTPTRTGECNVSAEFAKSDKREFVMAAPCCGHRQPFKPDVRPSLDPSLTYGPGLRYTVDDRGVPDDAWYECAGCGQRIEETSKVDMMATGVFEATTIGDRGHVGVYVNSMYSTDPRSTWRHVAQAHQVHDMYEHQMLNPMRRDFVDHVQEAGLWIPPADLKPWQLYQCDWQWDPIPAARLDQELNTLMGAVDRGILPQSHVSRTLFGLKADVAARTGARDQARLRTLGFTGGQAIWSPDTEVAARIQADVDAEETAERDLVDEALLEDSVLD